MNGGRGAKGSINDRLTSLMYRNRYKKLQLEKEAYSKTAKLREKEYLKSIQSFDIDDGTANLDYEDQLTVIDAIEGTKLTTNSSANNVQALNDIASSASEQQAEISKAPSVFWV